MKQHVRGRFEGHYVGTPSLTPPVSAPEKAAYRIQIYRGVIRQPIWIEQEAARDTVRSEPNVVRQDQLAVARVIAVPGSGHSYDAQLFDLEITDAVFSHPARHAGRIYGRIAGTVSAWFDLPAEPIPDAKDLIPTRKVTAEPLLNTELEGDAREGLSALASEVGSVEQLSTLPSVDAAVGEPALTPDTEGTPARPIPIPLTALVLAAAAALLVSCGGTYAGLWLLFLIPTLVLRRFLREVLDDSTPIRAIAGLLVLAQVGWVAWLLIEWSGSPCKELHVLPLIGLVASVFLSGILPFSAPFALNAAGFAIVLWSFGSDPDLQCQPLSRPASTEERLPSVKDPGVPRTDPNGRWPRTPKSKWD